MLCCQYSQRSPGYKSESWYLCTEKFLNPERKSCGFVWTGPWREAVRKYSNVPRIWRHVRESRATGCIGASVSGAEGRESKTVFDSGYNDMDSGSQVLDSNLCQWNLILDPIVSGIPDSKAQDSGFHKQNFPRFRIPKAKISRFQNHLKGATCSWLLVLFDWINVLKYSSL